MSPWTSNNDSFVGWFAGKEIWQDRSEINWRTIFRPPVCHPEPLDNAQDRLVKDPYWDQVSNVIKICKAWCFLFWALDGFLAMLGMTEKSIPQFVIMSPSTSYRPPSLSSWACEGSILRSDTKSIKLCKIRPELKVKDPGVLETPGSSRSLIIFF